MCAFLGKMLHLQPGNSKVVFLQSFIQKESERIQTGCCLSSREMGLALCCAVFLSGWFADLLGYEVTLLRCLPLGKKIHWLVGLF